MQESRREAVCIRFVEMEVALSQSFESRILSSHPQLLIHNSTHEQSHKKDTTLALSLALRLNSYSKHVGVSQVGERRTANRMTSLASRGYRVGVG